MMKKLLLISALSLLFSFGVQAQEKKINKSFSGVKTIEINTSGGDCELTKNTGDKVEVSLAYTYDQDVFEPILEQDGETLKLKEKFRKDSYASGSSLWKISIPDNLIVAFNSGSGNLDATEVAVELSSNVGSGDLDIKESSGSIKSNSGSGEAHITSYKGNIKVNTGSGDVELIDAEGEMSINLGSGDIDAEKVVGALSFNAGSGDINVNDVSLTGSSSFNSGSGDARVVLKTALQGNISINSGSGDATLDFNGIAISGNITMKANKRNGEISAPFKFDTETEEQSGSQTVMKKTAKIGSSDVKINIATGSGRAKIEN